MVTVAILLAGCGEEPSSYRLEEACRADVTKTIALTGLIEFSPEQIVFSPEDGILQWIIDEGTRVNKGEKVARVLAESLRDELDRKRLEFATIELDRRLAVLDLEVKEFELDNRETFARYDLETLLIIKTQLETGVDAAEDTRVSLEIENSRHRIGTLEEAIEKQGPFVEKGLIPRLDLEDLRTHLSQERQSLQSLELELAFLRRGGSPQDRTTADRDIRIARSNLALLDIQRKEYQDLAADTLAEVDARLGAARDDVHRLEDRLARTDLVAPLDGYVLHEETRMGNEERPVQRGISLSFGSPVVKIVGTEEPSIALEVWEADAVDLVEGQEVAFRLPAIPGTAFRGTLSSVSRVATGGGLRRWLHPDYRKVRARIEIRGDDPGFRPGMSADVDVIRDRRESVVAIPTAALLGPDSVLLGDGTVRPVRTGFWEDTRVEITSGLAEGESVRVPWNPPDLKAMTSVTASRRDLVVTIQVQGELKSTEMTPIGLNDVEGAAKLVELVTDGTRVEAGTVVATFSAPEAAARLKEKELDVKIKEKSLEMTSEQGNKDIFALTNQLAIETLNVEIATIAQSLLEVGRTRGERRDLSLDLEKVRRDLDSVDRLLDVKREFAERGFASVKEIQDLEDQRGRTAVAFDVAQVKTELAAMTGTPLDRRRAYVDTLKARLTRELKQRKLASEFTQTKLKKEKSALELEMARIQERRYRRMIEGLTVKAEGPGTVVLLERGTESGPRKVAKGDDLRAGEVFMQIASTRSFKVVAPVGEGVFHRIGVGTAARVKPVSGGEASFAGRVARLGLVARSRAGMLARLLGATGDRAFDVEIELTETSPEFQPGSSVRVEIETVRRPDAVCLPVDAVFTDRDGPHALSPGGERLPLVLGETDGTWFAIEKGIEPGQAVLQRAIDG